MATRSPSPTMDKFAYRHACLQAKPHLSAVLDFPYDLNYGWPDAGSVGVYIACTADMRVDYVGSVYRPSTPNGVAKRISEHRAKDTARRSVWRYIWVVPLLRSATRSQVRRAEARIGTLLRPPRTKRLPSGRM